jgi:phosphoglycerate dehydrogenase-like enzyme
MKYMLVGNDMETLEACYDRDFLKNGIFKTYEDISKEGIVYSTIEYAFGTWGFPQLTEDEIHTFFPSLKALFYAAGSVQYFARPFIHCGVRIFSAFSANAIPVAEFAMSQILLANKGFFQIQQLEEKLGYAKTREIADQYPGNFRTKVGLLGAGSIGRLMIQLLHQFDLDLYVFDPFMSEERARELGVTKADLPTIFSSCQTISNHLAKNEHTIGLLTYEHFSLMKDYTTFINTARGAIVNEEDLKRAMRENSTRFSLLDVLDPREKRDIDDDIFTIENIIVTPHRAGAHSLERQRLGAYMEEDFDNVLHQRKTKHEVFIEDLETMA